MPTIFEPDKLPVRHQNGTTYTTLADAAMLGVDALQVERISLEAGQRTEPASAEDAERFLYVMRGTGQVHIGTEIFPLAPESMVWIEYDDSFMLEAGDEQLEVLVCVAPAKKHSR